ncbi:MAG: VOC family protein, partial [Steroidobacteraceae bacterium]
MVISLCLPAGAATPATQIDHIILGINDLDQGMASFEQLTGVRPVYGGKHPGGTHNALVSLGDGLYLEIIAILTDATPPDFLAGLKGLRTLTPVGWAVASTDSAEIRRSMDAAGIPLTEPSAGSRATPDGATLSWQTLELQKKFDEAPFFIVWGAQSPHPSKTSPTG